MHSEKYMDVPLAVTSFQMGHQVLPIITLMLALSYERPALTKKQKKSLFPGLMWKSGCASLLEKVVT